jgi:hypothetical protein
MKNLIPKALRFHSWKHFVSEFRQRLRGWDMVDVITEMI